jgi:hypothetical protein
MKFRWILHHRNGKRKPLVTASGFSLKIPFCASDGCIFGRAAVVVAHKYGTMIGYSISNVIFSLFPSQ